MPLALGGGIVLVMSTWVRGSAIINAKSRRDRIPLADFLASLARRPRPKVFGTAVYLTADPDLTPSALLHNLKHNGILHQYNAIVAVRTTDEPRVADDARVEIRPINDTFVRIILSFGFMERPDVPAALSRVNLATLPLTPMDTSYFLGRRTVVRGDRRGFRRLQELLFISLSRNSVDPSEVFAIPPDRVV